MLNARAPKSPLDRPYKFSPEPRPGHRLGPVATDCTDRLGYPGCIAVAVMQRACTCPDSLTAEQHAAAEADAAAAYRERAGSPCDDCAMRPGSPEMVSDDALFVAEQQTPFRCHQGMPFRPNDDGGAPVDFRPRDEKQYPVCNGWAWARLIGTAVESDIEHLEDHRNG